MKKKGRDRARLSPELETAAARLADRARGPLGRLEQAAAQFEELSARTEGGFLGGNLLAIVNGAVLREMRDDTARAIARIGRREPSDVVDEADCYSSTVAELATLVKLLAAMELDEQPERRAEWEQLGEQLLAYAAELQQSVEEFEAALEAAEPEEPGAEEAVPVSGLRAASRVLLHGIWERARAGERLSGEEARLARVMLEHTEYHSVFERADRLGGTELLVDGVNPFAHVAMHVAVETQLETGDPAEVGAALERLTAVGLDRHEALHRMAGVFAEEVADMQRQGRPFDRARYMALLKAL